jgi:hypothetical protein
LPDDTESIIVTRGPIREQPKNPPIWTSGARPDGTSLNVYHDPITGKEVPPPLEPDFRQASQESSMGGIDEAGAAFAENIAKQKVRLILDAGRKFHVASIIPCVMACEFCRVIWFENAVPDVPIHPSAPAKLSVTQFGDNRITRLDGDGKPGEDSIYIAKPRPNFLVLATDFGFLKTMLLRMAQPPVSRTLLLDLPEWKYVDTQAPVWGVRHGHITFRNLPLRPNSVPKDDPVGIAFFLKERPHNAVSLRWLHAVNDNASVTKVFDLELRQIAPGVAGAELRLHQKCSSLGGVPGEYRTSAVFGICRMLMGYVACP